MGENDPEEPAVTTRPDIDVEPDAATDELRARARRIRVRAQELVDALGAEHPLVREALERADALDRRAEAPGQIHLR